MSPSPESSLHPRKLEEFECPGGQIKVIDVEPSEQKTSVPVLVIPGWGETSRTFETSISVLADAHRRVLTIDQPRWGPIQSPERDDQRVYPKYELTKALNVLGVLKQKGIEKADVLAHSEGAIAAVMAASISPDQFRSIVLVAPGGMIGNEGLADVVSKLFRTMTDFLKRVATDQEARQHLLVSARETIKSVLKNPPRAMIELAEAHLKSDIREMLRVLHNQGIKIAIIHGVNDPALPLEEMQSAAKQDQVDGVYSVKGDHHEIFARPGKYTALAEEAFTALEAKLIKESADNKNT